MTLLHQAELVFAFVIAAAIYFVPTFIAAMRAHPRKRLVFALNLLLGWTVIGWVSALIWASIGE